MSPKCARVSYKLEVRLRVYIFPEYFVHCSHVGYFENIDVWVSPQRFWCRWSGNMPLGTGNFKISSGDFNAVKSSTDTGYIVCLICILPGGTQRHAVPLLVMLNSRWSLRSPFRKGKWPLRCWNLWHCMKALCANEFSCNRFSFHWWSLPQSILILGVIKWWSNLVIPSSFISDFLL